MQLKCVDQEGIECAGSWSRCRKLESAQMRMVDCWGKQYSSRGGSAGRSRVEEENGRDESVVW